MDSFFFWLRVAVGVRNMNACRFLFFFFWGFFFSDEGGGGGDIGEKV
jgi:hypothetical protein